MPKNLKTVLIVIFSLEIILIILIRQNIISRVTTDSRSRDEVIILELETAIKLYGTDHDGYPIGDTKSVMNSLNGNNPSKQLYLTGLKIRDEEEIPDSWDTPIEIMVYDEKSYLIRSAGPNKIFGDEDDIKLEKKNPNTN